MKLKINLNPIQFEALTALHGRALSDTNRALRLMMVYGYSLSKASEEVGIHRSVLHRSHKKALKVIELAKIVAIYQ